MGLAVLLLLLACIGRRLPREYRGDLRPSVATVAMVWALFAVHFSLVVLAAVRSTWHFGLSGPLRLGIGGALVAVGGGIYLSAVFVFGFKRQSGLDTSRLVTEGVYAWSRNPILVGWTLVLAGLGLIRESGMVLFLAAVLAVGYGLSLPLEEELLGRLYGEAYERYRRRTRRYFGRRRNSVAA
jgi:protein-S-isoprenylcysteine O-methyltransferase Ste14